VSSWLVKSEPGTFSIADLERSPKKTTLWDGVRNYQARNSLRAMKKGDLVLFYHSNADPPGVVGLARVVKEAYPDPTALDPADPHFEPRATKEDAVWSVVDLQHVATFPRTIGLDELRATPGLEGMGVLKKGTRLSVLPVTDAELEIVRRLANESPRR
jgi:predicted RNA-binding protein with PUA-like domain